jgi:hypothetical protein
MYTVHLSSFCALSEYALILSSHSLLALKYMPSILQIRRKNKEYEGSQKIFFTFQQILGILKRQQFKKFE